MYKGISSALWVKLLIILQFVLFSAQAFAENHQKLRGMNYKRQLNEFIVVIKQNNTNSLEHTGRDLAKRFKGKYLGKFDVLNAVYLNIPEKNAKKLSESPAVVFVEANLIAEKASVDWGLDRINQRSLPLDGYVGHGAGGAGQTVYVVDSGIRYTHEIFKGDASSFWDYDVSNQGYDCNGHGTLAAGLIKSTVPYAQIKSVKVLNCSGSGTITTIVNGLNYIRSYGIPNSVVYLGVVGGASTTLDTTVSHLKNSGFHIVVPAGNSNINAGNVSPARSPDAITVSAMANEDSRASFSNWGSVIEMIAPGVAVNSAGISSDTDYVTASGTSFAAAYTAAALASFLGNGFTEGYFRSNATYHPGTGLLIPYLITETEPPPTPKVEIDYQLGEAGFIVDWSGRANPMSTNQNVASSYQIQEYEEGVGWSNTIFVGLSTQKEYLSMFPNIYKYKAKACNILGCSNWSYSSSITVTSGLGQCPIGI